VAILNRWLRHGTTFVAALSLVAGGSARARTGSVTEAQAKAVLLYNVLSFVDWPPASGDGKRFVIGVAGDSEVLEALRPVEGQNVKGHAVSIREVREEDDPTHCQVLYLSGTRDRLAAALLRRVAESPVLTVGDGSEFAKRGGIIFVYFDRARLRFDVNLVNANKAQLKISSKVLGLARTVTSNGTTD
jgi:hypothetical protein